VVVCNVETLVNVAAAVQGSPVTHKTLTISGAVGDPATLTAPVGTSVRECIEAAGGFTVSDPVLCIGGLMMGEATVDFDVPITKTTTGVIVLPRSHSLIQRKLATPEARARIGKSACDQCRYCTEYCPRYLLGYAVEPHQVMRSLGFTGTGAQRWNQFASLCCACGLCTLFSCPEQLFPKEACDESKAVMRKAGQKYAGPPVVRVHPMAGGRRVPIAALTRRLGVTEYDVHGRVLAEPLQPRRVAIALRQGTGLPNKALVKAGDRVKAGQVLGEIPAGQLGALIHAPFAATVAEATETHLILTKIP
jgi:Na+-translocating ferredoxin:NAD+ oxidoreductase RnfC subunit